MEPNVAGADAPALRWSDLGGIGPRRAAALASAGVHAPADLLRVAPLRYETFGPAVPLASLEPGDRATIEAVVRSIALFRRGRVAILKVRIEDASGAGDLLFFGQPYLRSRFRSGERIAARATVSPRGKLHSVSLESPESPFPRDGRRSPIYPRIAGLPTATLERAIARVVDRLAHAIADTLPVADRDRLGLVALGDAYREIHRPIGPADALERARRRLALEEWVSVRRELARIRRSPTFATPPFEPPSGDWARARAALGVELTPGQDAALATLRRLLARPGAARVLVQGDVGCGKTLVGTVLLALAALGGTQAALLAPTEILARQHHERVASVLRRLGIAVDLVVGGERAAPRPTPARRAPVAVGTHALLHAGVTFRDLRVVVIDEPQRFGVEQRDALARKGTRGVHVISMSATPIPRSLALALSGELELVTIPDRPPGRGRTATRVLRTAADRAAFVRRMTDRLRAGERALIVCPRIGDEAADGVTRQTVLAAARRWHARLPAELRVAVAHGRQPADERARELDAFRAGAAPVLVASTLVEVGLDVPEATVLLVEDAHLLGLA
ncbi:MAG TPA: DEAD/DEAH box helicase, partial [Planctomycetota bacterium]|nr:DEAD/DEAH box helicase [Planctomycetota bacterium]